MGGPESERRSGSGGGGAGGESLKHAGERRRSRSPAKGISAINNQRPAVEIGFHIVCSEDTEGDGFIR